MLVIKGWTADHESAVRVLTAAVLSGEAHASPISRDAATRTGGLPVYADMGAVLVLTPDGEVLQLAHEGNVITRVTETSWIEVALAAAAEQYKQFASLRPGSDG